MYGVFFTLTPVVSFEVFLKEWSIDADFEEVDMLLLKDWTVCKDQKAIEDKALDIMKEHETDVTAYYYDAGKCEFILQSYYWEDIKNG